MTRKRKPGIRLASSRVSSNFGVVVRRLESDSSSEHTESRSECSKSLLSESLRNVRLAKTTLFCSRDCLDCNSCEAKPALPYFRTVETVIDSFEQDKHGRLSVLRKTAFKSLICLLRLFQARNVCLQRLSASRASGRQRGSHDGACAAGIPSVLIAILVGWYGSVGLAQQTFLPASQKPPRVTPQNSPTPTADEEPQSPSPAPVVVQESPDASAQPAQAASTNEVSIQAIDTLKTRIDAATELTDEQKATANELLQRARSGLQARVDLAAAEQQFKADLQKVEAEQTKKQRELDAQQQLTATGPRANERDLLKLEQELAVRKSNLAQAQTALSTIETQIEERTAKQRSIKDQLTGIPAEKDEIAKQLTALGTADLSLIDQAKRLSLLAERQRLEVLPSKLETELALISAREAAGIMQLERQTEAAKVERLKQEIQLYTNAINAARRENAKARKDDLLKWIERIQTNKPPGADALIEILKQCVTIVDDELDVQSKSLTAQNAINRISSEWQELDEEFEEIQKREGRTGASRAFGTRLREQKKQLKSATLLRQEVRMRAATFEAAQLQYLDWRDDLKSLDDLDEQVRQLAMEAMAGRDFSTEELNEVAAEFRRAFEAQRESLNQTISAYDKYIELLDSQDTQQLQLADLTERFAEYIDERVLWIRSHDPLSPDSLTSDFASLKLFVDSTKWGRIFNTLGQDVRNHILLYCLLVGVWSFLAVSQSRQTRRIEQTSKKASSRLNTQLKPTLNAVLLTASKSFILPLPFLVFSWRLSSATVTYYPDDAMNPYLFNLSSVLAQMALALFCLEFIRNVHRPLGLAQSHFSWAEGACQTVCQQVRSFILLATPLMLMTGILKSWSSDGDSEALARVLSIGMYLLLAITLHRLANPRNGVLSFWVSEHRNEWIELFGTLLHAFLVMTPLSMAVLTAVGFSYATDHLAGNLSQTLMMLFSALFVRALLLRWLTLRQRRLAVEQARQARAALAQGEVKRDPVQKSNVPEVQDQRAELAEVSLQSRRLLNTTMIVLSLVGGWFIWTDVLPALQYFDNWTIPGTPLRLPALIAALVIGVLTATIARNLPGLLQITLLEWLPLEKSSRYAVGALVQYTIAILGLLAISNRLGIGWEHVQWLAAALTFGLGFGLQEIFANFVSGLIILFEQPVRVGDVVTIDGVSGVVNRIRIRSTTIMDWDRKEYIVPNKEFITGKLLNWTLTDTVNRIVIEVGVAYGTDPTLVHGLLSGVIRNHANILKDPEPVVTFDAFGDSSLNFTIRAYLPSLENRLLTIHELYTAINATFAAHGVEIPFPQRDLHIRSTVDLPVSTPRPAAAQATEVAHPEEDHA